MLPVVSPSPSAQAFAAALQHEGLPPLPEDLGLVLGGDGTMLQAIHAHGAARVWLGLNFGNLGFLMNDVPARDGVAFVRARLAARAWTTHGFLRLSMRAQTAQGALTGLAVNDVYVERQSGHTCHLRVWVDESVLADRLTCDGIIVATPLGSTAYSFSAGGSASHPLVRSLHLTAICPHAPKLAPIVLPEGSVVRIEVLDPERRPARAVIDGVAKDDVREVEVASNPKEDVSLAFFDGHDFTRTLLRKVLRR
jgi:NAD+ kinase